MIIYEETNNLVSGEFLKCFSIKTFCIDYELLNKLNYIGIGLKRN